MARPSGADRPAVALLLLLLPAFAYLVLLYVYPIEETVRLSLGSQAAWADFLDTVQSHSTWVVFRQTFSMAVIVTASCLLIGYPLTYLMVRVSPGVQRVMLLLVLLPYWISTLVRSYAWIAILGRKGVVNTMLAWAGVIAEPLALIYNRLGAVIGMVNVVAPIMVLVLYAAFVRIEASLSRIGLGLGGRPWFVFCRVWLPLSLPGVVAGCILVFLISLGVFTTPAILGGSTEMSVAMLIEQDVGTALDLPAAAAISTLLLAVTFVVLILGRRFWIPALLGLAIEQRTAFSRVAAPLFDAIQRLSIGRRGPASRLRRTTRTGQRPGIALWSISLLVMAYLLVPVVVVIGLSFSGADFLQFPPQSVSLRWFEAVFQSAEWVGSAERSFVVGLLATLVATILGTAAAYGLERGRFPGRPFLYLFLLSPLVVPPTILAFGLYYLYARLGWIGHVEALAAAHVVLVLPFVMVTVSQGVRAVDPAIEFAAGSLGGSPAHVFRRITLPLLRPAILSGCLLAFLTSFDELIIALFVTSPRSATLPKKMWDSVRFSIDPTNAAAATLLIALSVVIVGSALFLGFRPRRAPR